MKTQFSRFVLRIPLEQYLRPSTRSGHLPFSGIPPPDARCLISRLLIVIGCLVFAAIPYQKSYSGEMPVNQERLVDPSAACFLSICGSSARLGIGNDAFTRCCEILTIKLMREINRTTTDFIRRQISGNSLVYFIDTATSPETIRTDLESKVGKALKSTTSLHNHSVATIIKSYKKVGGLPMANYFRIGNQPLRNLCIVFPLSHNKTSIEFASNMMGDRNLPVVDQTNDYVVRFLAAKHEGYHCISASTNALGEWGVAARETIADVGAVNKALKSGIKVDNLIAMSDWRAIRFASGIADVVAGRVNGKDIYFRASPAHMSTLAIKRLVATGPVDRYEQIQKLALSNTFQGLYGEKKQAQRLLTRIFLLYKNMEIKARFPNATIQDADDIHSLIGAPREIVETVRDSVSRYLSKLR